ncbi:MAG: lipopolysaccharide transport system ATP-binding protein [Parcubacteria group bacterium Gr01-1014_38]|nr:MAG: lipopolysaccharide transport system ATP-binding protein [Parcubacteria group bacterium Gr01-1014_38]
MMGTPIIHVRNLTKSFPFPHARSRSLHDALWTRERPPSPHERLDALRDVNFSVRPGEFLGIIGPNGSGKSTLLKILTRIYPPTTGTVMVQGTVSPFLELGVGFHPELTARENVFLYGTVLGLSLIEIRHRYTDIAAFAGLEQFMEAKLKTLSSGMQVRLAFSVAIHVPADILLLDEVLAVGDAEFQERCFRVFARFKEERKTVVLVSHDLGSIREFADRIILLHQGSIVAQGIPEEVIARYRELQWERRQTDVPTKERRFGDGKAKIMRVRFVNDGGQETTVFHANEVISICLDVVFEETCEQPVFGLIIHDAHVRNIFVTNTHWQRVDTDRYTAGELVTVEFRLPNELEVGRYTISPAIAHRNLRSFHDWREHVGAFFVDRPFDTGGMAHFQHDIRIFRASPQGSEALSFPIQKNAKATAT